jgi:periplasmic divalent cation tolerance protein
MSAGSENPTGAVIVLVTAPSEEKAAELGRALVEEGLAACANLIPRVRSIYRWEGKVEDEAEVLIVLKTRAELFERLRARVVALHPYQVPEVIQLAISAGHAPYLAWIASSTQPRPPG